MAAYYNEIEPAAAHVLEHLIKDGIIADGVVDRRSIADVEPADLKGFTQAHFFAGGGLWSIAARLAGWPDDRPLWTGSCPCQPFSVAGKGAGTDDPRHLWPHFFRLIRACRPPIVVGEQVAGKAGYGWFDGVRSDLESENYASRGVDIPACAVNAPHIRQRLYWCAVGNADSAECSPRNVFGSGTETRPECAAQSGLQRSTVVDADTLRKLQPQGIVSQQRGWAGNASGGDMAHAECDGRQGQRTLGEPLHSARGGDGEANQSVDAGARNGYAYDMADADNARREGRSILSKRADECSAWSDGVEWRSGADGKTRRVKSGIRLLVDAGECVGRVQQLRIGCNAIVAPLAAAVLQALMEEIS